MKKVLQHLSVVIVKKNSKLVKNIFNGWIKNDVLEIVFMPQSVGYVDISYIEHIFVHLTHGSVPPVVVPSAQKIQLYVKRFLWPKILGNTHRKKPTWKDKEYQLFNVSST